MELIVATFFATTFTFVGHLCFVIAQHFERPKRRLPVLPQAPLTLPPAPKRWPLACTLSSTVLG